MRTHSPRPPAIVPLLAAAAAIAWTAPGLTTHEPDLPAAAVHDNREPAGEIRDGARHLRLRAARAAWRAEGERGPARTIEAFGEVGGPLTVPAPLIRVREGETIVASVRNELASPLRVHGLCARDGTPCAALDVPAGEERDVRFNAGRPGTYHYWATITGTPLTFRASGDTQLSGAFIVDPADGAPPEDRVFVITEWTSLTPEQLAHVAAQPEPGATFLSMRPDVLFSVNGLAWPHTERLQYALGERVRWRVINLSTQVHPMHLHGFYFDVESYYDGVHGWSGAGTRTTPMIEPGERFVVRFTPPRAGTFIYHTHLHENRQLTSGLYGALLVIDPEDTFDPEADHVFVVGRGGPSPDAPVVVNGVNAPRSVWRAGTRHRIRLINITPNDTIAVSLRTAAAPVQWRLLAKDGAALDPTRTDTEPASQVIGVGETYDFEYAAPPGRASLWLEVRSPGGKWFSQGRVIVQ